MSQTAERVPVCDHCGLPLPSGSRADADPQQPHFCCLGCRFAASLVRSNDEDAGASWTLTRLGLGIFFAMNVMVFTMALWTQDVYDAPVAESSADTLHDLFRYLCLMFSLPVMFLLGGPLLEESLVALRQRRLSTDLLLACGVAASFVYSLTSVLRGSGHVYFEVACMVLVAVTLGRWLEAVGKVQTTRALRSLEQLLPDEVLVRRDDVERQLPARELRRGDTIRVLAGQRVAVDGQIDAGCASLDQQVVTGESRPVAKSAGDPVLAGSLNLDGDLWVSVEHPPGQTAIDRLVATVTAAASEKERWGRLADRVAAWFLPIVAVLGIGTLVAHAASGQAAEGLLAGLAVVVVACPCALALATPLAIWAAFGRAARQGIVIRNADAISRLNDVVTFCFDKTGTLTTGEPVVRHTLPDRQTDSAEARPIAAALAAASHHSVATAIQQHTHGLSPANVTQIRTIPGRGLSGWLAHEGIHVFLGSERFMVEQGISFSSDLRDPIVQHRRDGLSLTCLGWEGRVRAVFVIDEQLRSEAIDVVGQLRRRGRTVQVLTGDEPSRGRALADQLQVPVHANLLPEEKLAMIRSLRSAGPVAMIGDGINDAPALAQADVGLAMGCGADVSRQTADVCLLSNNLRQILELTDLSRETCRTIRWNLTWSLTYNALAIPVAAAGWLNPIIAAIAMVVSSLLVVTNSLRLAQEGGERGVSHLSALPTQPDSVPSDEHPRTQAKPQGGTHSEVMA